MKSVMLGVPKALLLKQGAVCRAVAVRMAQGALRRARADVAAAVTGVAGPEPDEDGNPVGLVYCCVVARGRKPRVKRRRFGGSQAAILKGSVEEALRLLKKACR